MQQDALHITEPEVYASNVTRQWVIGYPFVIIKIPDVKRDTVDCWFSICKTTLEEFQGPKLFAFHDMADKHIGLTPYSRVKAQELLSLRPDLQVYTALHLQKTVVAQFISVFLRQIYTAQQTQIFFEREKAIKWLFEQMGKDR